MNGQLSELESIEGVILVSDEKPSVRYSEFRKALIIGLIGSYCISRLRVAGNRPFREQECLRAFHSLL